ncbi:rhomboid-like protein [Streptomyces sp. R41]|uniref:Rhomboid-like protein n=1 Tax=Streptomyces sp. R41 TaxID=3238632 RepID=A0AB39RQV6_9ACTN
MDPSATARAEASLTDPETGAPLLDGLPRQRGGPVTAPDRTGTRAPAPGPTPEPAASAPGPRPEPAAPAPGSTPEPAASAPGPRPEPAASAPGPRPEPAAPAPGPRPEPAAPAPGSTPEPAASAPGSTPEPTTAAAPHPLATRRSAAGGSVSLGALARRRLRALRPWRLFPTPLGTPFTFGYAAVLVVTSLIGDYADPSLVHALHQGSSTDVAHLVQHPMLVLVASALWIVGGVTSPYAVAFLVVLTALERRIGGLRTAGVFLLGHVVATLATEMPVGLSVLAGHLPDSSLHRLDYGISFGVAASVGALAGLLSPWLRWPVLIGFGAMLVGDLLAFTDPMTDWGHLMSLTIGISTWPLVRRWRAARGAGRTARTDGGLVVVRETGHGTAEPCLGTTAL